MNGYTTYFTTWDFDELSDHEKYWAMIRMGVGFICQFKGGEMKKIVTTIGDLRNVTDFLRNECPLIPPIAVEYRITREHDGHLVITTESEKEGEK